MPSDDPKLRAKIAQRNPGLLEEGERLSYDLEFALGKIFVSEIEALRSLEPAKTILMICKDYSPE